MTDKNHPTGVAQCAGEPVVWVSFTERGYVRFWTTDKTRAVAEMAAGSFAVRPYTVDDLMGMVVRASAAQPPAAPVESGRMAIAEIIGGKIFNDIPDVIPGAATRYAREDALKKADAILALVSRSSAGSEPAAWLSTGDNHHGLWREPPELGDGFHVQPLYTHPPQTPVWQTIDTAPKDGTEIIGMFHRRYDETSPPSIYGPWTIAWDGRKWRSSWDGSQVIEYMSDFGTEYKGPDIEPTHWHPLPDTTLVSRPHGGGDAA